MTMRDAYIEKVTVQLEEWQASIERYKRDAAVPRSGWPVATTSTLQRLEERYQSACGCLEVLLASSGGAWETAKEEVEQALINLKMSLDESGAGRNRHNLALHNSRSHVFAPFPRKE